MSHPSDGHLVELRTSPLDWRDYGDKEAIHNGNILDWWNGMDWQTVRYESAGRAHAFLVMEGDTTHTRDARTTVVPLGEEGDTFTNARDTNEIRMDGPLSV